ncbi:VC1465 family Xer recombination activation factor [Paucibacter sp. APW11]|uniref:VC1465 family Xer recombination activation factor n=1 Tax=Roseateles aquae TaxID=3077235 RepID=A0ABU3P5C1_9BURK|nr:VC1465 family Xer recombination activation factor [Paucibacter sp. APW11]MDT8997765.1 VC1465 family Xer recombination activation factor [Paucibacter sp. APW11]
MEQGRKLRSLYRYLGYSRAQLATFLQVSERTIYHWEAGDQRIPFSVIKLLRLMSHQELPGATWQGWCFNRGTLWSPEGHGFDGKDFAWLNLTVRRSAMFTVLSRERVELRQKLAEARQELARAEEQAITAEGRAGVLELAVWGVMARERRGLSTQGVPVGGAQRTHGQTLSQGRDGLVTRPAILTGENSPPRFSHDELLDPGAMTLPDGTDMPWRVASISGTGGVR